MLKILAIFFILLSQAPSPAAANDCPPFSAVYSELRKNLSRPNAWVPFYHVRPAPKYPAIYLWDSAFISLVWKILDPAIAKDIIKSVLYFQHSDGRISHQVTRFGKSKISQAPLLSYAAVEILKDSPDLSFAREVYPKLKKYHEWFWNSRRLKNGLFFWAHPYESGIDNSPRFSNRDESKFVDTTTFASPDLSAYLVVDCESMRYLANLLGFNQDAQVFGAQAQELTKLTREMLWDENRGLFFDLDTKTNQLISIPSIASLLPLFAGIPDEPQVAKLLSHLQDPSEFNTPMPLPTIARNDIHFEKDTWRGPVWINTTYMVIKGLKRYGQMELAHNFSDRLRFGVYQVWRNTGKFVEFYDPERFDLKQLTRKKGTGPFGLSASKNPLEVLEHIFFKELYLGRKPVDHFVGWTGLVNNLFLEEHSLAIQDSYLQTCAKLARATETPSTSK